MLGDIYSALKRARVHYAHCTAYTGSGQDPIETEALTLENLAGSETMGSVTISKQVMKSHPEAGFLNFQLELN